MSRKREDDEEEALWPPEMEQQPLWSNELEKLRQRQCMFQGLTIVLALGLALALLQNQQTPVPIRSTVSQAPVSQAPVSQAPVSQAPVSQSPESPSPRPQKACIKEFVRYIPSPYENDWMDLSKTADLSKPEPCEQAMTSRPTEKQDARAVVDGIARKAKDKAYELDSNIFSRFIFRDSCTGEETTRFIEPLVQALRSPLCFCKIPYEHGFSKEYVLLPHASEVIASDNRRPRVLFFDAGASSWDEGAGGPSMVWFHEELDKRGLKPDRYTAFEAKTVNQPQFFAKIPVKYKPYVSYFNIPISHEENNPDYFWGFVKALAKPEDWVMVKIDIDTTPVEVPLAQQLLAEPEIQSLVDEFVWEHHVEKSLLSEQNWARGLGGKSRQRSTELWEVLEGSYKAFQDLRKAGVVAHSWV